MSQVAALIRALSTALILAALYGYRLILSPIFYALGARCRFHPSCSVYAEACVRHYGPLRGSARAALRVLKCHPFHPGGYDPPVPESPRQNG